MENRTCMTLGSLFDGSGGFPLGGILNGIQPLWASEVEPFPIRVTTKRIPQMKHYGDVSALNGAELPPVDIITFGSPCQDMSIAGKRAGLDGSRSNLFYQAVRIVKEMRCATDGKYPRFIVWENVPGAFSSNGGGDFQAVLQSICEAKNAGYAVPEPPKGKWAPAGHIVGDGFDIAWRTVDAQYWGVPQRRRRIYLVADFTGGCAGKILFESEGLSGYPPQGFCPWKGAAGTVADRPGASGIGSGRYNGSLTGTASQSLTASDGTGGGNAPMVFQKMMVLNDQGGQRMDVTEDVACTLRAEAHHPPCVVEAAGFCTEHSANARSIGYEKEKSPTLRAGTVPAVFENHSQDTRYTGPLDVAQTVSANYGMGGNNQPFVVDTPKTLKIRSGCEGGGKGALIQDNLSATLATNNDQALFVPKAYGVCSKTSHSMLSDNPHSGFYEADTSRTLDQNGGNPTCNQGGIVVLEGNGSRPSHRGDGYSESDTMYTLNTVETHAVAYGIDRAAYNQGQNAQSGFSIEEEKEPTIVAKGPGAVAQPSYCMTTGSYTSVEEERTPTLMARDYKDPPVVNDTDEGFRYIVRRLTPTECARLQGFPDWWCSGLGTKIPSDAELDWWTEVFETHRRVMGSAAKPKTRKQIFKWLQNPHSDAAEYKLWGNGVCLSNVCFVLAGIVLATQLEENTREGAV